ncbi:MAG: YVTN family beta-propeller repeat protein [Limisphaerales bacterium]
MLFAKDWFSFAATIMLTTPSIICASLFIAALTALSVESAQPNKSKGLLLVCNKGDHTLSIIDPESGEQIAAVPEDGITGHEVIASADGKLAFVPIYGNAGVGKAGTDGSLIRVIDLDKKTVVGTIDFHKGVRPHCAIIGPKNHLLYVSTELEDSIKVIDPKSWKVLGSIPTGQTESHMFAITSDGKTAYSANVGPGTVSIIDVNAKKVSKVIPISAKTQRISISPDDKWVFTADQTKPQLAVIDAKKNEVVKWVELPALGYGTGITPDGKLLIIAIPKLHQVAAVDLNTFTVIKTVEVPKTPQFVLVRPDGKMAYVSCDASKQVAAIDVETFKVQKLINAGAGADGLAWAARK